MVDLYKQTMSMTGGFKDRHKNKQKRVTTPQQRKRISYPKFEKEGIKGIAGNDDFLVNAGIAIADGFDEINEKVNSKKKVNITKYREEMNDSLNKSDYFTLNTTSKQIEQIQRTVPDVRERIKLMNQVVATNNEEIALKETIHKNTEDMQERQRILREIDKLKASNIIAGTNLQGEFRALANLQSQENSLKIRENQIQEREEQKEKRNKSEEMIEKVAKSSKGKHLDTITEKRMSKEMIKEVQESGKEKHEMNMREKAIQTKLQAERLAWEKQKAGLSGQLKADVFSNTKKVEIMQAYNERVNRLIELGYIPEQAVLEAKRQINMEMHTDIDKELRYDKIARERGQFMANGERFLEKTRSYGKRINLPYKPVKLKNWEDHNTNQINLI